MNKFIFISVLIFFSRNLYSQVGIFKTYNDYLNNKLIEYDQCLNVRHFGGNFKVVFKDKMSSKITIDVDRNQFWGFKRDDGRIFRIDKRNNPNVIISKGKIVVYGNYSTDFSGDRIYIKSNQFLPSVSKGLDGEMIVLNRENLEELLIDDLDALERLKQTKKNRISDQVTYLIQFIIEYNGNPSGIKKVLRCK